MRNTEPLQVDVMRRIREDLRECIGSRLRVRANKGRKVVIEKMGVIEETYPHIFVVRVEAKSAPSQRVSYTYTDILTKTVELSHPETNEALFSWLNG